MAMRAKSVAAARLHRGLPFFGIVFGLGQPGDVERGMSVHRGRPDVIGAREEIA
jgi:hypothetical protein